MICNELWDVVNKIGKVCFSLSELIEPAVKPGVINNTRPSWINAKSVNKIKLSLGLKNETPVIFIVIKMNPNTKMHIAIK